MFSGVSGLQSHSTWLDVIGNNISNVNTVAFKSSRVTFADTMSQTVGSASGTNLGSNLGGVNPQQIGLGSRVGSIQTLFNPGPTLQTGNATDIAIQGDGFLVVEQGSQTLYTRAGNLTFDGQGFLVDANGGFIQGFTATVQYSQRLIQAGPTPLNVTDGSLVLDTTNTGSISRIQVRSDMTLPPRATTQIDFAGNLDSFAGVIDCGNGLGVLVDATGIPYLPLAEAAVAFNAAKVNLGTLTAGQIDQIRDYGDNEITNAIGPNTALVANPVDLNFARGIATANWANYAWNLGNAPSNTVVQTVYDSLGTPREITILMYQVEDMSTPGINSQPGPSQAAYAWYAFDTTDGRAPFSGSAVVGDEANLIGGSGIAEGFDPTAAAPNNYNRGIVGDVYFGDLLYFNSDGSLASQGGVVGTAGAMQQTTARLYLSPLQPAAPAFPIPNSPIPTNGAEILAIDLNFGTAGTLQAGRRDGLFSDAAGTFQVVNGVNTYVPNQSAYVREQDGYRDGSLVGLSFDQTGVIKGEFSNGEIVDLGQVVMARIDNPEGLAKVGGNYYATSANSGSIFVGLGGQNGLGTIQGFALEGSNVDLTVELSNLIIAQRGFEVNARSISTTNETLNTLVNLGR
jgi:flagellar hook protein FlgE